MLVDDWLVQSFRDDIHVELDANSCLCERSLTFFGGSGEYCLRDLARFL